MLRILKEANYPILFIAGKLDTRVSYERIIEQITITKNASSLVWKYRYQWRADDLLKIYIYFLPPDVK